MSTFHPFPRLPLELRTRIWEMTVEPREVDVRMCYDDYKYVKLVSSTPIPAVLQTCQEARNQRLYQEVFFLTVTPQGKKWRYVWLNLDIDLVNIGTSFFAYYKQIASSIKRLKFERENSDEFFYHSESQQLKLFTDVEEIHVVCADSFWSWSGVFRCDPFVWPCADDKLTFIDPWDGRVARGLEMDRIYQEMYETEELANTEEAGSSSDEYPA